MRDVAEQTGSRACSLSGDTVHRVLHGLVGVSSAGVSRDLVFVLSDPSLLWHRRVEASVAKNFVEEDNGGNGHADLLCCTEAKQLW